MNKLAALLKKTFKIFTNLEKFFVLSNDLFLLRKWDIQKELSWLKANNLCAAVSGLNFSIIYVTEEVHVRWWLLIRVEDYVALIRRRVYYNVE